MNLVHGKDHSAARKVWPAKGVSTAAALALLLSGELTPVFGNPIGGHVAGGSATINTGPGTVTVRQSSPVAVINWQTFSINSGEQTTFIQPSSSSAVLNRVLGGQTSFINGTLSANGQVYLINGNGIIIGPGGMVNTAAFTASTRDIADSDFLKGNLHFTGDGNAGVKNLGTINAIGGDVYLIGQTVDNEGAIHANAGTAGLAAGDDVYVVQGGPEHVVVNPVSSTAKATGQTGVKNGGTITATAAELKAANGNLYALAINNTGTIRATTLSNQGGQVWLTADSGRVVNSGVIDASATASGGHGGTVTLQTSGAAMQSGEIVAHGGQGGVGGNVDISAKTGLGLSGTVDLTTPGGTTGNLVLDPTSLTVVTGGKGKVVGGTNDPTSVTISPTTVDHALSLANLTLDADNSVIISNPIMWTTANTLTLQTNNPSGSTIALTAIITVPNGRVISDPSGPTISANAGAVTYIYQNAIQLSRLTILNGIVVGVGTPAAGSASSQPSGSGSVQGTGEMSGMSSVFTANSSEYSEVAGDISGTSFQSETGSGAGTSVAASGHGAAINDTYLASNTTLAGGSSTLDLRKQKSSHPAVRLPTLHP